MKLKRAAILLGMAVLMMALPVAVSADNPHFVKADATLSGQNLIVSFKEAGLGSFQFVYMVASANATVTYECVNGGGKNPSASNKQTTQTTVSTPPTPFTVTKSGNVSGSLTLSPPSASSVGFSCPPGQTTTFVSVTYFNVQVSDLTTGDTANIPGTFTYTNPSAPPVS